MPTLLCMMINSARLYRISLCPGTDITPSSTATSETTSIVAIIGGMLVVAILIISVAVIVVAVTRSKNRCGFVTTNKNEA